MKFLIIPPYLCGCDTITVRPAVVRDFFVIITVNGRYGGTEGLDTGFIVSEDGLLATDHHVLGEAAI